MKGRAQRVAVAMSGGVDSSTAAALLLEQGHEVIGLTLQFDQSETEAAAGGLCAGEGVEEAVAVAKALGIPHHVVACPRAFTERVLRPAWEEYDRGRTPNPCVLCNKAIKFGLLLEQARELGAERLATGHYATLHREAPGAPPRLGRGRDRRKDQSYFLFALDGEQLDRALFPLGGLCKEEVKALARRLGLPNADRPESQDVCLKVGEASFAETLRLRFGAECRSGFFVDETGQRLGSHRGIHHFTVGQRHGHGVALGRPAYVQAIHANRAEVVLSTRQESLQASGLCASDVSWAIPVTIGEALEVEVQVRYRHAAVKATLIPTAARRVDILFTEPQRAVTPGQAAVFYRGEWVIGGGWIDRAFPLEREGP